MDVDEIEICIEVLGRRLLERGDCLEKSVMREEERINVWRTDKPTVVHGIVRMAIPERVALVLGKPYTHDARTHIGIWTPKLFQTDDIADLHVELGCRQHLRHLVGANIARQAPGVESHMGSGLRKVEGGGAALRRGQLGVYGIGAAIERCAVDRGKRHVARIQKAHARWREATKIHTTKPLGRRNNSIYISCRNGRQSNLRFNIDIWLWRRGK